MMQGRPGNATTKRRISAAALVLAASWSMSAMASEQLLAEAVHEYQAALDSTNRDERLERFRRSELLFSRLVGGSGEGDSIPRLRNASLYVNLGNAALGAEHLGPAIVAYRRALEIDPDHARARQNLRHARSLVPDWVPQPEEGGILDTFFAWSGQMSRGEQQSVAALFFFLAALPLAASIRWRRPVFRMVAAIPALVWLLLMLTLWIQSRSGANQAAVIIVPETVARAADSSHAPARFRQPLPSGAEVEVTEVRGDWAHIRLANGRDAWVHQSTLEWIAEDAKPEKKVTAERRA